jgi:hypothetical protein
MCGVWPKYTPKKNPAKYRHNYHHSIQFAVFVAYSYFVGLQPNILHGIVSRDREILEAKDM